MKKILIGVVAVVGLGAVVIAGVAFLRPDLVPAWARIGTAAAGAKEYGLYCDEHGVPEKLCTICHPELKDKLLLCPEHGNIPEDICTLCHPEVEKKNDIEMCPKGHGLPKHFCSKCDAEAGKPTASSSLIDDGYCKAFGRETHEGKTVCQLLPVVRLASAGLAERGGAHYLPGRSRTSTPTSWLPLPRPPTTRTATPRFSRVSRASSAKPAWTSDKRSKPVTSSPSSIRPR